MADQDRKATALYLIVAAQASNYIMAFTTLWTYVLSPKIKILSQRQAFVLNRKVRSVSRMPYGVSGVERVKNQSPLLRQRELVVIPN